MTAVTSLLSAEQRAVLALWTEVNASLSAYHKLISNFGTAGLAWNAKVEAWRQLGIHSTHLKRHEQPEQTLTTIDKIQQALLDGKYGLLFADQPDYPAQLLEIYDPPPLLFYRGDKARLQQAQIAIVGSRKPTAHAQKITFDMAQYLAQAGYIITSGLALGVDKRAHLGALAQSDTEYQGRTIGVMGTGIDVNYPNHHDKLFGQIIDQGGCIVSELLPHTQPHKHTFPRRNRLVAGLSLATIVTEATIQSGSLITARLAAEQDREVFSIPGSIHSTQSRGCHKLIKQGAKLVETAEDILEELTWQSSPCTPMSHGSLPPADNGETTKTDSLLQAMGHDPFSLDELAMRCNISPDEASVLLLQFELEGQVATVAGGRYQRLAK